MKIAGLENVLYCDTDSLFLNSDGHNNIKNTPYVDDKKLGCLKLEKKGNVNIFGCKDYNFNKDRKTKGISRNSKVLGKNKFSYTQFMKIKTSLRKGFTDGVYINNVVKELKQQYKKANIINNKKNPFYLNL